MYVIHSTFIKCRYPSNTDSNPVNVPLALLTRPEGCSLFTVDSMIPAVNSFISKIPLTLWVYQLDPFMNLSDLVFNFKPMSDFKLSSLIKTQNMILFLANCHP